MGGSKSKSSQASNVVDRRIGAAEGAIVVAEGSNASFQAFTTDYNAISGALVANIAAQDASARTSEAAFNFGNRALETVDKSVDRSLDTVDVTVGQSLNLVGETVDDAFEQINQVNRDAAGLITVANKSLEDISVRAIESIEQANRSDAQQSFNKLLSTSALVAIAWVVFKGK